MSSTSETRTNIEATIEKARRDAAERIGAIDRRLRGDFERIRGELDLGRIASENAPQLVAAGVATGLVLGYSLPRPLLRVLQVAAAVGVATVVAKKIAERVACECDVEESVEAGSPDAV